MTDKEKLLAYAFNSATLSPMISVKHAEALIAQHTPLYPAASLPIKDVAGHVLRQTITADRDMPPFNRVTMDGIAIRFSDQNNFTIENVAAAGQEAVTLNNLEAGCIKIMTGAVLPEGCDCVIPIEQVEIKGTDATVNGTFEAGQFIHRQGGDRKQGEPILEAGVALNSTRMAAAASVGQSHIQVTRLPAIAIVTTGDELVEVDQPVEPFQIRRSNNYALDTGLRKLGFDRVQSFHYADDLQEITSGLERVLQEFDLVLLSGGVSMGEFDFIPKALQENRVRSIFHKVMQRPGKPLWFGLSETEKMVFGLPGNPISTLVCFHRYVIPALFQACGVRTQPGQRMVRLKNGLQFPPALTYFPPVTLHSESNTEEYATLVRASGSGDYIALSQSDGFIELPAEPAAFKEGYPAKFYPWI